MLFQKNGYKMDQTNKRQIMKIQKTLPTNKKKMKFANIEISLLVLYVKNAMTDLRSPWSPSYY